MQFFWATSPLVQFAVAAVMIRRRLHRDFPMFLAYTVFRASTASLMFLLYDTHFFVGHLYGYTNLIHETGCVILRFAVIYELFGTVLKPYSALGNAADASFRWGTAALLMLAVVVAVYHHMGPYGTILDTILNLMDRTVDIIQSGLLLALLVCSRYLRLSWRNYAFGIVVGLGVFATIDLANTAILMETFRIPTIQRAPLKEMLDLIGMAGYLLSTLIWLGYALLPAPVPEVAETVPEHDLDSWSHELQGLLRR